MHARLPLNGTRESPGSPPAGGKRHFCGDPVSGGACAALRGPGGPPAGAETLLDAGADPARPPMLPAVAGGFSRAVPSGSSWRTALAAAAAGRTSAASTASRAATCCRSANPGWREYCLSIALPPLIKAFDGSLAVCDDCPVLFTDHGIVLSKDSVFVSCLYCRGIVF